VINGELFFTTKNPAFMNWSLIFLAQRENREGGPIVLQLSTRKIHLEKELKKIRNAEMGKFLVK
jgi:hypothetical protein